MSEIPPPCPNSPIIPTCVPVESLTPPLSTQSTHPMVTQSKVGIFKPKLYNAGLSCGTYIPINRHEALQDVNWKQAMEAKFQALMRNQTWVLVLSQPEMNIVQNKYIVLSQE